MPFNLRGRHFLRLLDSTTEEFLYLLDLSAKLKADKRAFFTACSKASKAADYLRGLALAETTIAVA